MRSSPIDHVLPAREGTYVLTASEDAADSDLVGHYRKVVIGWAVSSGGSVWPLTVDGLADEVAVLFSDGRVEGVDAEFSSIAEFNQAQAESADFAKSQLER